MNTAWRPSDTDEKANAVGLGRARSGMEQSGANVEANGRLRVPRLPLNRRAEKKRSKCAAFVQFPLKRDPSGRFFLGIALEMQGKISLPSQGNGRG
jgi:hypothetical protein